jgi:GTPase
MSRRPDARRQDPLFERPGSGERAILVCVGIGHAPEPDRVQEFGALARSAGAQVLEVLTVTRRSPEPRFFLGTGKVEELRQRLVALGADLVVVDNALTPGQERNLEKELNCRVLDRSGLILDIFAQRARTFEGKLQVELAQLEHVSTRLVRGWTHLERQKGGIGLRGPGETQLETDRRLVARRIKTLNDRLDKVLVQRETTRQERKRGAIPTVALVGYTNAGKSTLFNRLTSSSAYTADQLFATLDPTVRRLRLAPGLEVALADTVGFVRDLPHELVAAFRSTLQEAREADLLLHVIDAADPERNDRIAQVNEVLESIGAQSLPQIAVYNKIDISGEGPHVEFDAGGRVDRLWLSAQAGLGLDLLRDALHQQLGADLHHCILVLPPQSGRARAQLFEAGAVLSERLLDDGSAELEVNLRRRDVARICREAGIELPAAIEPCAPGERFLQSTGRAALDTAELAVTSGPDAPLIDRPQAIGSN